MVSLSLSWFLVAVLLNFSATVVFSSEKFSRLDFPPDFIFGSGTSAFQVEGAANEDGRTPSIFDTFVISRNCSGINGDVASDQYHKYKEDVQLMVDTGLDAYRFSISWSRLIPKGRGPVNPKGLEYYNNLINELVRNGIEPHVTLHHSDLPQDLEDEYGGLISPNVVKDFTAFANVCFREFGDRVKHWTTFNEPNVFIMGGYDSGFSPPQRCSHSALTNCSRGNSSTEPYLAAHYILLSHASAARLYKNTYQEKQQGLVGMNLYAFGLVPASNATEDVLATQRAYDFMHGWFMDPLVFGDYPDTMKKNVGSRLPVFTSSEAEQIKGSIDFVGVNHYFTISVKNVPTSWHSEYVSYMTDMQAVISYNPATQSEAPADPRGMQLVLEYFKQAYGNPLIYIHENGQMNRRNSSLNDTVRVEYHQGFIGAVLDAVRNGSNTKGYFIWSFIDVFELLDSNTLFGLYWVDFSDKDLKRYPKLSAHWYSSFLRGGSNNTSSENVIEMKYNISVQSNAHLKYTPWGMQIVLSTSNKLMETLLSTSKKMARVQGRIQH